MLMPMLNARKQEGPGTLPPVAPGPSGEKHALLANLFPRYWMTAPVLAEPTCLA